MFSGVFDTSYTGSVVIPRSESTPTSDDVLDALNPRGRRRSASMQLIKPEDLMVTQNRRDRVDANALDVWRNMSLLAWMIRRTLDYCCLWDFQPQTEDDGLNRDLRFLMARDCEAANIDYVGRMDWDDMRRVLEVLKILTGDAFTVPLAEGTLQNIEGSYCRNPQDTQASGNWINGAKLNARGRVTAWNFRQVRPNSPWSYDRFDREVPARNVWQHIQYDGRLDQIRGISPITAILNECRDIYETFDHARAKVKLDQIFGVAIFRKADDTDDLGTPVGEDGAEDSDPNTTQEELVDFGGPGPMVMDREVGESVQLLQAANPAQSTQEFLRLCIHMALKALDLPMNFFDEANTNFFGSRAAWNLYERSCWARRATQLRLHHRLARWRLFQWTLPTDLGGSGEIKLPASMTTRDVKYRWVSRGLPWWKPDEELSTNLAAAAAGLKTMQGICDEFNLGVYEDNLAALRRERDEAQSQGFVLQFNPAKLSAVLLDAPTAGAATV